MQYAKINNGAIEFAPKNKGSICNYNQDIERMKSDGYKEFETVERHITNRYYHIEYEETIDKIRELIVYENTQEQADEIVQQEERNRLNHLSLTKREVFLALYKDKGITPQNIRNQITDESELIEFDYAGEYYRGNPLINQIGAKLGYSSDDLDYLFQNRELPHTKE